MQYTLLLILIILTIFSFISMGRDPFAPGFLMCASFTFSCLCMCYNAALWEINTDPLTVFVISGGCLTFVIANIICQFIYKKKILSVGKINRMNKGVQDFKNNGFVSINRNLVLLVFVFDVLVLILYFIEVIKIAGFGSFTTMMYIFRQATGFQGASVSFFVNILVRISKAFTTIFIFYCIRNVMAGKSIKSQLYLLFPVLPDLMCSLLTGGRFRLLQFILGPIVIYGLLYFVKYGRRIKVKISLIAKVIVIAVFSLLLFYNVKSLVGRAEQTDIITYVTEYFGGPIELFDVILRKAIGFHQPEIWGRNTFASFYRYFVKFFGVDIGMSANPGWLTSRTGINLGNVFTCFFIYYADFGLVGVFLLSFVAGCIWSVLYYKSLLSYKNVRKIIYSFVFYGVLFQFYDEMTFTIFLSADMWMSFLFICFFEKHIKTRVKI